MIQINNNHLALRPQCGICADIIFAREKVIAIYGSDDSSSYSGRTQPFTFPPINRKGIDVGGFSLCRSPRCRRCPEKSSPELVTIHLDCYSVFTQECHVDMDALWLRSAWRFPWRGAHPLHISDQHLDSEGLKRTAEAFGLSDMCRLPCELLDMIHCYSNHSLFWRYIPVLQFASCMKETAPKPLISFQLGQVLSWKRNEYPKYITSEERLPIIRLTIDSEGICRVERLSCAPVYSGECNDSYRTIVQDASDVAGIEVQFKDGLMRLKVPRKQPALPIWNTSAPPDLTSGEAYGTERLSRNEIRKYSGPDCFSWQHLHAVEVDKIRGITFCFHGQTFAGIHIHYEEKPSAMDDKYKQFVNRRQDKSTWIYLPISKNDQLLALDIRQMRRLGMNILSRTRLAGDIIIGPQFQSLFKDLGLSKSTLQTIVYSEALEGSPVTFLDTYSKRPYQDEPPKLFPLEKYGGLSDPHPLGHAPFSSWAPLDDISSTLTFNDRDTGFCRGIMFQYGNGGCRTVGQCRWHVDLVIRVGHPRVLQFRHERKPECLDSLLHVVRVAFQQSDDGQIEKGWECHPLKGFVAFWYKEGSSYLAIKANKAHPDLDMSVPERMNLDQRQHQPFVNSAFKSFHSSAYPYLCSCLWATGPTVDLDLKSYST